MVGRPWQALSARLGISKFDPVEFTGDIERMDSMSLCKEFSRIDSILEQRTGAM